MAATDRPTHFPFAFEGTYAWPARLFGITPGSASVTVADGRLVARFGPWTVSTPVANVVDHTVSGPYSLPRTIGPAHVSFADRGLTFATNHRQGLCLTFRDPVTGLDPLGLIRHPGLTVTVADPQGLAEAIDDARAGATGAPSTGAGRAATSSPSSAGDAASDALAEERAEQAAEDDLHTMTASELRALADERGLAHPSRMKRADLVDLLEADLGDDLVDVVEDLDLDLDR